MNSAEAGSVPRRRAEYETSLRGSRRRTDGEAAAAAASAREKGRRKKEGNVIEVIGPVLTSVAAACPPVGPAQCYWAADYKGMSWSAWRAGPAVASVTEL
jgi:hypothetical protein